MRQIHFIRRFVGIAIVAASLVTPSVIARADSNFVTSVKWGTLYVQAAPGVVQQDRNEFDAKGVKQVDSATQHPTVWIRKDVTSVTVLYKGGAAQARKQVQFFADNAGAKFTFSDDISSANKIVTTDDNGEARVTYTVENVQTDDYLRVSIADCDYLNAKSSCPNGGGAADVGGPLILTWEKAGYYPILKLDMPNQLRDVYWDWSEFKNSWVGERTHVYIKTYLVGSTIKLPYNVTDIWGEPIANYPISLVMQAGYCGGNIKCKWANTPSTKYTDAKGRVEFIQTNKNTAADACKNIDPTTKKKCGIGANFQPTTNQIPESADIFWPQFVNDMTMTPASINYSVLTRGGVAAADGNHAVVNGVTDPALPITTGGGVTEQNSVKTALKLTYLYNAEKNPLKRVPLYAPDVVVSASPGAYVLNICPDGESANDCHANGMLYAREVTSISQMYTTQTFGYTYPANLMFVSTVPGKATFTMKVGNHKYTITQDFSAN